jgi:hypothetical protein
MAIQKASKVGTVKGSCGSSGSSSSSCCCFVVVVLFVLG